MSKNTPGDLAADILARINAATSLAELTNIVACEAAKCGLPSVLMFDRSQWNPGENSGFVIARDADYMQEYGATPVFGTDPVLLTALARPNSFRYSVEDIYRNVETDPLRLAARGLREHDIIEGWVTPVHGRSGFRGVLALAGGRHAEPIEAADQMRMDSVAIHAFERASRLMMQVTEAHSPGLNARELDTLQWLADGTNVRDIGWYMGATDEEVWRLIAKCLEKLGARTPVQAVATAIRQGVLA